MAEQIHAGHRARLKERFRREGLSGFSQHEVLELLLTYAIPQRDVNPLAHALIVRFGSLSGVLEASESELLQVPGVGPNAATLLTLMPPLLSYYQRSGMGKRPVICNLAQARQYCGALFFGAHEERFYVVCMDKSARVIHTELLHRGTIDEVAVYPRPVVEIALRHHAHAVLLAHNHPGGIGEPSQDDYTTTRAIVAALRPVGVGVVDHLIFCGGDVHSMTQHSECDMCPPEEFSYFVRSRRVPGTRGALREENGDGLVTLRFEGL